MKRENEHRVVAERQERHVDFCGYAVSQSKVKQGTKGKERKDIDDYIAVSPSFISCRIYSSQFMERVSIICFSMNSE